MESADGGGEEAEGLELTESGKQATGSSRGAGSGDHGVQGGSENVGVGQIGVLGMPEGKWAELAKVGVGGATGPGTDRGCQRVSVRGALGGGTEGFPQHDEIVGRDDR